MELRVNLELEVQQLRLRIVALEARAIEAERQTRNLGWSVLMTTAFACAAIVRSFF